MQQLANVLLVDDDNDILLIFKKALEREGYRVGAFSSPADAIEHFNANPSAYDLLLTDIKMQGMSGFELAKRFKDINSKIKLLFTTAFELNQDQIESELGLLAHDSDRKENRHKQSAIIIPKPAKLEKIISSVREALSDYSSIASPSDYEHLVILYQDNADNSSYYETIAQYINAGLAKNQLCIYTYVESDPEIAMSGLSQLIKNYKQEIEKGNLLLVDFKPFCASAIDYNLKPFQGLMDKVNEMIRNRTDKHVRIVGRAAGWLYENRYFDQCLELERWWHTKPFTGSLVCPYKMSLFEHKQFFEHQDPLFLRHDTVLRV